MGKKKKGICNVETLFVICFLKKCLICVFQQLSTTEVCSRSLQQTHFQSPGFCGFMPSFWLKQQLPESNGFLHCKLKGLLDILQAYIRCINKLEIIVSKKEKFSNSRIMQLISPTTIIFNTCILPWFLHLGEVIHDMKTRLASNISSVPSYKAEWGNGSETTLWVLMHMQMWVSVADFIILIG